MKCQIQIYLILQNLYNFIHSHFNKQHLIIYILSIHVLNKKLKTWLNNIQVIKIKIYKKTDKYALSPWYILYTKAKNLSSVDVKCFRIFLVYKGLRHVTKYTPFWRGAFIFFYCHGFHWLEYQIMSKLGISTQYCKIQV